jgi:hypothetical protein
MKQHHSVDALELLRSQHTEIDDLIAQIERAGADGNKQALFEQLADKLAAHTTIEEQIFYPAVMSVELHQQLVEATEEHLAVKRLLADMLELDCDDEHFDAKLTVLKESVRHHAHVEEEGHLFLEVEDLLDEDRLAVLGNELLVMFEALIDRAPRNNVRAETRHAADLHV